MSVQAIAWVLEHSESRLGARCVLMSIANHAKADGTGSWPSVKTIAKEARLSDREVQYATAELRRIGELSVQISAGPKGVNMYSLPKIGITSTHAKFSPGAQQVVEGCTENPKVVHTGSPEPSKSEPSSTEPFVVPVSLWLDFIEMRKKIHKPLTGKAGELIRDELLKFKECGFDAIEILENSIRNCWPDVYEPRKDKDGTRAPSREQQRGERSQQAIKNALGHRSRLADALRANLSRGDHGRTSAALPGSTEGHSSRGFASGVLESGEDK